MLNWQEIIQDYIVKYFNRIKKTTTPLKDHFGVEYFTYHRIDRQGKYTVLVDRPDWAEQYVSEKIFLDDPYLRHPDVYNSGLCFVEQHGSEQYRERVLKLGKQVLNVDIAVQIINKQPDFVEFFGFSGSKRMSCLEKLYLNNPTLLKSFASHFKKEFATVLTQMEEESDSLLNLKGKDFLCNHPICPGISSHSHLAYLNDLGLHKEIQQAAQLTKRERQCLKLLIEGKSAKETAAALSLSYRTVEFYLENIKNKWGCWSKQELSYTAIRLEELGLL